MNASERVTNYIHDRINLAALEDLVRGAVALNGGQGSPKAATKQKKR